MVNPEHDKETKGKKRNRSRGLELTSEVRKRFKELRRRLDLTVGELAAKAHVSEKHIRNIESSTSPRSRFDEGTLAVIARALNQNLDAILSDEQSSVRITSIPPDFESMSRTCVELDKGLLPVIRDLRLQPARIDEAFKDLLVGRLRRRGIELSSFTHELSRRETVQSLCETRPPPDLEIEVGDRLEFIRYRFGAHVLEVQNPHLLWDCHCKTPGRHRGNFTCPIHAHPAGTELDARFDKGLVVFSYRGRSYYYRSSRSLWPPSVDSFAMYADLETVGLLSKPVKSLLDLGSGTGFLGIALTVENPYIRRLVLSDWLLTPLLFGQINWALNSADRSHVEVQSRVGLFTEWFDETDGPFDVVVCNPPYLPLLPGFDELGMNSTVAGTDLLTHVVANSRRLGREVFVQFSSIALKEARLAAKKASVRLRPIAKSRLVPFRVPLVWQRPEYLSVLVEQRGLLERPRERHRYWHRIQTFVIG